ncbi:BTAD domain-containing putative transcriptional regulator [Mycobacterium sp. Dal123C01]|uniref:BTAD domain-containing putative transcriptional regulator n=1 Tax=Mycobacterium sp. Dal123C01 TaxID=3457577 RepID=UPI00403EE570
MELGILGPLQVRQDGRPVTIPGAKPRAILAMLGLHTGSVVPADVLINLLWGDDPPRTAAKALQTHISSLRRALGDGVVVTEGAGWTLKGPEVDASRYKRAAKRGRDAAAAGDTSQAVTRFEEALVLWRGIPELPDGQRGLSEKTRWIESHAALVEDRADALLATGRAAEVIGDLEAAVAEAPLRERRWSQLMLALYRAGRQGEALGAYQRARSLLADELGVDPGPELRRLEAAIVAQDTSLDIAVAQNLPSVMRAVTFLLTDIEGSTAAWEADADAMAVALARHDELVEQVVTSRGGRLIKTRGEGDATFSVFERPSGAASAAIELHEAITHEPWALREPIRIRMALHTGEVELRDGDYFGRAVNRVARLRSLAEGGQILCSGATAELVIDSLSDDVMLTDLGMRQLKNLARPEHVFELRLDTTDDRPPPQTTEAPMERPGLPAVLVGAGPFVGRGDELERLLSAWQTALAGGVRTVLIAGEPGVGKTRLAGEWSQQAYEQGAVVLYGRCDEDLGAPYQPFAEALRALVPCMGADRLRGLRGVEALLPLVPGLTDVVPDLAPPTRADPDTERYALFDALVALLEIASSSTPIVLILDDLHWAAKPTLLLLRHLLRFGDHARVQIVGTYRSTDLDRSHPLAAMLADLHRDGTANRLNLSGLDEDDVTTYVAEAGYDDEELAHALAAVTGGNPFFLIEALRHVDESGGVWDQSTLPQGVREAVSRRLSRLPVETNKALAAAAVVGSRFAVELVEQVVGNDLIDAFEEACQAGIVIEEPGGNYRFNHAIVRQSLLAELASVRRMRLHQRIATTLEAQPGADDELLAELAHHYFECAWAGNAVKAVEYCRRAADQAMARLAYEGAADLYDRAIHALEEIDDELPDRDDQTAELLVARCEALLAAGDVASAAGAVSQLQQATVDSARLAAWATCFDGQLSMLIHPERLDEVEAALGAAAAKLAELGDAAGEAKAHTVRAGCLFRLGRVADCEIALDDALTAARRAREHRWVNAVLAGAPLAALWGPNPVPRAGGRCLDVVRLLRITTDSPAVEATSTRCQAVLEAFRGRAAAARRMIDSARRTVTELGLRHAVLEVEQFAGIVELIANEPAAAEAHLRKAYNGFRRMGLDADTAETAALLGRTCLALGRDAEADELCTESERLAGHALKASIAWRTLRAHLLARGNDHDAARRIAEAAVTLAERTDALVDHGDACFTLATVLGAAGDSAGARAAAERAIDLYERKGAVALADMARGILSERPVPPPSAPAETPSAEPDNACVRAIRRGEAAADREAWDEFEQLFAPEVFTESRRKITGGFIREDFSPNEARRLAENGALRLRVVVIAVRGERLALARLQVGTADVSPGAPHDEMLELFGLDDEGRIATQVSFDIEDMEAAVAELDAAHTRFEETPDNACVRAVYQVIDAVEREAWDEVRALLASEVSVESRRKIVGFARFDLPSRQWPLEVRRYLELGMVRNRPTIVAVRGERLVLCRLESATADVSPGAPQDEMLQLIGLDDEGRISLQVWFDVDDIEAAITELDAVHARFEGAHPQARRLENTAALVFEHVWSHFAARNWDALADTVADNYSGTDHRRVVNAGIQHGRDAVVQDLQAAVDVGFTISMVSATAIRGERLVLARVRASGSDPEAIQNDALNIVEIDTDERIAVVDVFDIEDIDAAIAELDSRFLAGEGAAHAQTWSVVTQGYASINRGELPPTTPDWANVDHRRGTSFAPGDLPALLTSWNLAPGVTSFSFIDAVHRLNNLGAVITSMSHETSPDGVNAEWRVISVFTLEGDLINRLEVFDETDLEAAIATFEGLQPHSRRLENAASRVNERLLACFSAGEWEAVAAILAEDITTEDRRRVVNAGVRRDRDAEIKDFRSAADLGATHATSNTIATRGERLALTRYRYSQSDEDSEAFSAELLGIVEINADDRIEAWVVFDLEDIDAAFAELDARYLAGEAAAHAQTWSVITAGYAALTRHQLPRTTPDFVSTDHRRGTAFAPGELIGYLRAAFDQNQNTNIYVEKVHRLCDLGAVVTHWANGTSRDGFDAEWLAVNLVTADGDAINRCELFDEADLDAALARLGELHSQARRLENAASQVAERLNAHFAVRDWDAMTEMMAEDAFDDDRRRVVNSGVRHGRDVVIANVRAVADVGITNVTSKVIATRGECLALSRDHFSVRDQRPEAFLAEVVSIVEIDADERIVARVAFDPDDIDAALAELDARYLAGEAAPHAQTWSVITSSYAAFNRRELSATTPDFEDLDHRRGAGFAPGDMIAYLQASWADSPDTKIYIAAVHRLSNIGAAVTHVAHGISHEGFDAEWRDIHLLTVEDDMFSRCELFDEADLDAALVRFDQLSRSAPRLQNAASQVYERMWEYFRAQDWIALTNLVADDELIDDRRRVVNGGVRHGRNAGIQELQAAADIGFAIKMMGVTATRGNSLALTRIRASGRDPGAIQNDVLQVVEIDADERIAGVITFDLDDFDAAIAELDSRYLTGEAADHAHTWSVVAGGYAATSRRKLPAMTPNCVTIDHRRAAAFSPGELTAYIRAGRDLEKQTGPYIEAVHQLSDLGAVVAYAAYATSHEGFDAEWHEVTLSTLDGDLINRCELFDETDLDAALTRFEELTAPARQLENVASQVDARYWNCFAARDWNTIAEILAEEFCIADHRRILNAGVLHGRDVQIRNMKAIAEIGANITSTVIATRGQRLALARVCSSNSDLRHGEFGAELLSIIGLDDDNRIAAGDVFDIDDLDAAFAELETRYLAGEAVAHAHTWSVIAGAHAVFNRHEVPPTASDLVNIDHRHGIAFAPGDLIPYIRATLNLAPQASSHVETVPGLSDLGAVFIHLVKGTSREGFAAEWRETVVAMVDGDLINHIELFDVADLDTALARFEELHPQAARLENAASQVVDRFRAHFAARDWDAMVQTMADSYYSDDRRCVVGAGVRHGQGAAIDNYRAIADVGFTSMSSTVIATRGERVVLGRMHLSSRDKESEPFRMELLVVIEITASNRIAAVVVFDLDDVDAAFEELDARYLAGEAAAHAPVWQRAIDTLGEANRHEPGPMMTGLAYTDHRRVPFAPGDFGRAVEDLWSLVPDARYRVTKVHALDAHGVVASLIIEGADEHGNELQWARTILLVSDEPRMEVYEEGDVDAALAKFEQLTVPAPRLENAARRVDNRFFARWRSRDWAGVAETLADGSLVDDRRRTVNAGLWDGRDVVIANMRALVEVGANITSAVIATRGARLALTRICSANRDLQQGQFGSEMLGVVEIDTDDRIVARIGFEAQDIEAAFEELDARYLAGEAADHAHTWSVIAGAHATFNRHEIPPTTPDSATVDHRRGIAFAPGDFIPYMRATWNLAPQTRSYIEAVHRLTDLGVVVTHTSHGTSREGFDAEWREVCLVTADGDTVNRCEIFEEADLDAALARFEELHPHDRRLQNAASRVNDRFFALWRARDWAAVAETLADGSFVDDRRRTVNAGFWDGRDVVIANMRALAEVGANMTLTVIASRGEGLALTRFYSPNRDLRHGEFGSEMLGIVEIDTDDRIAAHILFEPDDFDAAIAELEARYLAGEAGAHAQAWSAITRSYVVLNRGEIPTTTTDMTDIDHRSLAAIGSGDLKAYLRATFEDSAENRIYIETVHRLTNLGAVVTNVAKGTSRAGFYAEWRMICLMTADGGLINHGEMYDETDLDTALARFEELHPQAPRLENGASRAFERYLERAIAHDWDAMAEVLADDYHTDDRRHLVGGGVYGRDAEIASVQMQVNLGVTHAMPTVIAVRGERLVLSRARYSARDQELEAFVVEILLVIEINAEHRSIAAVAFDPEDIVAAFEELDARYLAGEAAAYPRAWSVITREYAALNRGELPPTMPDWVDHRPLQRINASDLTTNIRVTWELIRGFNFYIEAVHRLSNLGAITTRVVRGRSSEGFDAEWREVDLVTVEGDLVKRCEIFDEADLDAALARFEELRPQAPRLKNAASQVAERFPAHMTAREWDAIAELLAADVLVDDRRRGANAGIRHGLQVAIDDMRAAVDVGFTHTTSTLIATRGERLALMLVHASGHAEQPDAFQLDVLQIVEINAGGQTTAVAMFDNDDIDAAFEELDARYLAGEAAAHAHTWSVIAQAYTVLNRGEMPVTTPDFEDVDHRRGTLAPGDLMEYLRAALDDMARSRLRVLAVHRLTDLGALVTHVATGTSREGFDAEWRIINVFTVDGDLISRCEMFDEADLDAALAKFDELDRPRPLLENDATRALARIAATFNRRDIAGLLALTSVDGRIEDRRRGLRVVHAGPTRLKALQVMFDTAPSSWRMEHETIAIRGSRLTLSRERYRDIDDANRPVAIELLRIMEIIGDGFMHDVVAFDPDDMDTAFKELNARYLAGEAAAHAHTWSIVTEAYDALNRGELPTTTTDFEDADRRSGATMEPGDLMAYLRTALSDSVRNSLRILAVPRLTDRGAVVTNVTHGTTQEGFEAEWRMTSVYIVEGDLISRCEIFDETDLDAALARFEDLDRPRPLLENDAIRVWATVVDSFNRRDENGLLAVGSEDGRFEDRRKGLQDEFDGAGRKKAVHTMFETVPSGWRLEVEPIAIRGSRLSLTRGRYRDSDAADRPIAVELLHVTELGDDGLMHATVNFDPDDMVAAFEELEARYLAGEAAVHAHTWSVIARGYGALNRAEIPALTPDSVDIDNRLGAKLAPGDLVKYLGSTFGDSTDNIRFDILYAEAVHRLTGFGTVVTHVAKGTSQQGFDAEWRMLILTTVEGDRVNRSELFDEADLDTALARFDELES